MTDTQNAGAAAATKNVLVVEDDALLSDLLARKLGPSFSMQFAQSGEDALKMIEANKPYLVLLDVVLPGIDGFEVLTKIKGNPATADIRVVMLSNVGQQEDMERAKQIGAEQYIVKVTLSLDEVTELITKLINEEPKAA